MFSPARKVLPFQFRSISHIVIKSDGFLHLKKTNLIIAKRNAVTDYIATGTKYKFFDFVDRLKIMNPLNKTVSTTCNVTHKKLFYIINILNTNL